MSYSIGLENKYVYRGGSWFNQFHWFAGLSEGNSRARAGRRHYDFHLGVRFVRRCP